MKDLALDNSGDLDLNATTKDFKLTNDISELKQKIWLLLNTNVEELDWNADVGINFLDLLANIDNLETLEKIINDYLLEQLPDIVDSAKIMNFKKDKKNRKLFLNLQLNLKSGINFNLDTSVRG